METVTLIVIIGPSGIYGSDWVRSRFGEDSWRGKCDLPIRYFTEHKG